MNVMEKCKSTSCQCTVLSHVIDNTTAQEVDLNTPEAAEIGHVESTLPPDTANRQYCCAHCEQINSTESENCSCGHEDCKPTESMSKVKNQLH